MEHNSKIVFEEKRVKMYDIKRGTTVTLKHLRITSLK